VYQKLFLSIALMSVINSTNKDVYEVKDQIVLCPFATVKVVSAISLKIKTDREVLWVIVLCCYIPCT